MRKLICWILNHKYVRREPYTFMKNWERITCTRCGKDLILNHETRDALDWDLELHRMGNDEE